jgi:hypothetical protein
MWDTQTWRTLIKFHSKLLGFANKKNPLFFHRMRNMRWYLKCLHSCHRWWKSGEVYFINQNEFLPRKINKKWIKIFYIEQLHACAWMKEWKFISFIYILPPMLMHFKIRHSFNHYSCKWIFNEHKAWALKRSPFSFSFLALTLVCWMSNGNFQRILWTYEKNENDFV